MKIPYAHDQRNSKSLVHLLFDAHAFRTNFSRWMAATFGNKISAEVIQAIAKVTVEAVEAAVIVAAETASALVKVAEAIRPSRASIVGLFIALFFSLGAPRALAQVTVYTDKTAFLAAAQAAGVLSFTDNLNSGSLSGSTATFPNGSATGSGIVAFPNGNATNTVDGTGYLRFLVDSGPMTITFNSPIVAFGFDTNPRSQGVGHNLAVSVGGASSSLTMPLTDTTEFRGYIVSSPFTTFTLSDSGAADDFYGIDNLVAYGSTIPEPSTYAAFAGLVALGFVAYRRRRKVG